ncbi:DegT/DnrJ/EryC1/StrS family aminotransferase [Algoriphagus namhaensis]
MIPVTKPFLPDLNEYQKYLEGIWQRQWLTNNGPLVNELELKVAEYLGVKNFLFLGNGTIALQIAIKALDLKGEIITTPFSYVATTSSIVWEGCTPVFVDIDESLTIDPKQIEKAIGPNTSAILATHVYGNPCDIEAIDKIAKKHNLKVIYDAAHCFGVTYKGKSIFEYGDVSTVSFHATKIYHTVEGGGVFTQDKQLHKKMAYMRNFGHDGPLDFHGLGINGKNSELHAAVGLVVLRKIGKILAKRREIAHRYDQNLKSLKVGGPKMRENTVQNYGYYPVLFESEELLLKVLQKLNRSEIFPRRYFYPSLNSLPYVEDVSLPITEDVASRILCLPSYFQLSSEEVDLICRNIQVACLNGHA